MYKPHKCKKIAYGEENDLIYLLVSTEFKRTAQKLGKLEEYSKMVSKLIDRIDKYILNKIEITYPPMKMRRLDFSAIETPLVKCIRESHNDITRLSSDIEYMLNRIGINPDEYDSLYDLKGVISQQNYRNIIIIHDNVSLLEIKRDSIKKIVQIQKEEEMDVQKIIQSMLKEKYILMANMEELYHNEIIKGADFRAIILNHHFFNNPYLHIVYTVIKYDTVKNSIYVDIFTSTEQYIRNNDIKQKDFIPKFFDENNSLGAFFAENYANKIYNMIKNDLFNQKLLVNKLSILDDAIYTETGNKNNLDTRYLKLKLQKNIAQYLSGKEPIDDNQTKVKLCNLKTIESTPANSDYIFVIGRVKQIITEKKILENKSYTVIATSINLLKNNIIIEKEGEEDSHAEAILMRKYCNDSNSMERFRNEQDIIYVIRLYQNGNIGCGLPCTRCVKVLTGNGINKVIYSMDHQNFQTCKMDTNTYTYTTTGNKLLNIDLYLYEEKTFCCSF